MRDQKFMLLKTCFNALFVFSLLKLGMVCAADVPNKIDTVQQWRDTREFLDIEAVIHYLSGSVDYRTRTPRVVQEYVPDLGVVREILKQPGVDIYGKGCFGSTLTDGAFKYYGNLLAKSPDVTANYKFLEDVIAQNIPISDESKYYEGRHRVFKNLVARGKKKLVWYMRDQKMLLSSEIGYALETKIDDPEFRSELLKLWRERAFWEPFENIWRTMNLLYSGEFRIW